MPTTAVPISSATTRANAEPRRTPIRKLEIFMFCNSCINAAVKSCREAGDRAISVRRAGRRVDCADRRIAFSRRHIAPTPIANGGLADAEPSQTSGYGGLAPFFIRYVGHNPGILSTNPYKNSRRLAKAAFLVGLGLGIVACGDGDRRRAWGALHCFGSFITFTFLHEGCVTLCIFRFASDHRLTSEIRIGRFFPVP